ncbi:porin [Mucilaginibacter gotjawali]|nr:porin [Mucilaginibacter gotjawali]MBB3055773.1 phosphate-selective porin [Mucilaginibacter gotjawali]
MKQRYLTRTLLLLSILFTSIFAKAQQNDDMINILLKKHVISQQEADSIRSDEAIKAQAKKDKEHVISVGTKALQISGLLQERYQAFQQVSSNNGFDLHRIRLIVSGNVTDNWSYYTQTELSGSGVKLVDAYTAYKFGDYLKVSAGQFKIPFSLESLTSDAQLEFIDRSQVVEALVGRSKDVISVTPGNQQGRDIGLQINGSFAKIDNNYLFDYTFGVFNGAGYDVTGDNNYNKDIAGRLSIHPVTGLIVSGDFYNGVANYGTPAKNQKRNRGGFDARYVIGPLSVQAEYDKGTDGSIKRDGYFAQAAYFIVPKKLQLAAKYDNYDPNKAIKTDRAKIYTGGVNYFFNNWAKLTVDYLNRREEAAVQVKNDILEVQLQLAF